MSSNVYQGLFSRLIGFSYRRILKPVLFLLDPEFIHDRFLSLGAFLARYSLTRRALHTTCVYQDPCLRQTIAGIPFPNPVGLSAGFDKNVRLISLLPHVGFGAAEFGSITALPYAGNPKPRLVRLPRSKGIVVNYGLMNDGVQTILPRLHADHGNMVVGISVAKTNSPMTASVEGGIQDYLACLRAVQASGAGDYYTLNVSCPNAFGGEPFTTSDRLALLLDRIQELCLDKPLFIKLPINLPVHEFDALLRICVDHRVAGVVIGNLTKARDPRLIHDPLPSSIKGGISGKPTQDLSNACISYAYQHYGEDLYIIGVGGVFSAEDAYDKIRRGASLIQLITGMIFEGPQLIGQINSGLVRLLARDGFTSVADAVGSYYSPSN